jgi:tetratricopeptide (TPR) repeat protein/predicted Ser/Thr protein kinase
LAVVSASESAADRGRIAVERVVVAADDDAGWPRDATPRRRLGRYVVLDRLGTGGMGTVYLAYDPELDRRVAVKVLRADRASSETGDVYRRRLRQEAKTLAKLSHPNIVRVFDVGFVADRSATRPPLAFVAMELLDGLSLRRWLAATPRKPDEILAVFAAVARGLGAAHQAGIVHRDFKPDNVVVCADGRPVVLDFGIARGTDRDRVTPDSPLAAGPPDVEDNAARGPLTNPGRAMGTPAYMAPEQHLGGVVDGRSDQYGWCVALWEAFAGARPFAGRVTTLVNKKLALAIDLPLPEGETKLPVWLVPVLRRGMSPRPDARFATMDDAVAAIDAARPRRGRRRWLAVSITLSMVAAAIAIGSFISRSNDRCVAGERSLDATWDASRRSAIAGRFADSDVRYAPGTWTLLEPRLADYAERWRRQWTSACTAAAAGDRASARELTCLDGRLQALAARLDVLATATPETIENASRIVVELQPPERCAYELAAPDLAETDLATREQVIATRASLAGVEALEVAGRWAEGLEMGERALQEATRIGYQPLVAEALFLVGRLDKALGRYDEAAKVLTDAAWTATSARHDELAARAMIDLVVVVGRELGDPVQGHVWANNADAAIRRAGGDELLEAGLLNNLGLLQFREGLFDDARRGDEMALEIRTRLLGREHLLVASSHNNLGSDLWMLGRYDDAEAQLREAIAVHEAIAGPDHPRLAASLDNLGALLSESGDYAQAKPLIERALRIREQALAPDHPSLADTLVNLGALNVAVGDSDRAIELFERARGIIERGSGPDHPSMATCLSNLGGVQLERHDYAGARASFTKAADIYERNLGPDSAKVGLTLANLGETERMSGNLPVAIATLERSVRIVQASLGPEHPRLSFALGRLGLAVAASGEPLRAVGLLERAIELGSDVEVVRGQRGTLELGLAKAIVAASGGDRGDLERARALALQARERSSEASKRRDVDQWLATLPE